MPHREAAALLDLQQRAFLLVPDFLTGADQIVPHPGDRKPLFANVIVHARVRLLPGLQGLTHCVFDFLLHDTPIA